MSVACNLPDGNFLYLCMLKWYLIYRCSIAREIRFFYPFEVQLMDRQSYDENERGRSAHSEYKKSQIQTAMRRVMGNLVDADRV